jgi:hypothetical protein
LMSLFHQGFIVITHHSIMDWLLYCIFQLCCATVPVFEKRGSQNRGLIDSL